MELYTKKQIKFIQLRTGLFWKNKVYIYIKLIIKYFFKEGLSPIENYYKNVIYNLLKKVEF